MKFSLYVYFQEFYSFKSLYLNLWFILSPFLYVVWFIPLHVDIQLLQHHDCVGFSRLYHGSACLSLTSTALPWLLLPSLCFFLKLALKLGSLTSPALLFLFRIVFLTLDSCFSMWTSKINLISFKKQPAVNKSLHWIYRSLGAGLLY